MCNYLKLNHSNAVNPLTEVSVYPGFVTTYLLVLTNVPAYMPAACSTFRGSLPRRFLHPVYRQAQGWPPVRPAFRVQRARHPAARRGGGP